jgi:hypothetical protein
MSEIADGTAALFGRCAHCGKAIGVYAPSVWATDDGRVVVASPLSVEPRALRPSVAAHLHADCWNKLIGRRATRQNGPRGRS